MFGAHSALHFSPLLVHPFSRSFALSVPLPLSLLRWTLVVHQRREGNRFSSLFSPTLRLRRIRVNTRANCCSAQMMNLEPFAMVTTIKLNHFAREDYFDLE